MKKITKLLTLSLVLLLLLGTLAACGATPNSDPAAAKTALEDSGYAVTLVQDGFLDKAALAVFELAGIDDIEAGVSGTNKDGEHVTIFYFEEAEDAAEEWDDVKKYMNDEKADEEKESEWVIDKSGKMIFFGTKNAIKAAK